MVLWLWIIIALCHLFSSIWKIFEKVVFDQALAYFPSNNLYSLKDGSRGNYSSYLGIIELAERIMSAVNNKNYQIFYGAAEGLRHVRPGNLLWQITLSWIIGLSGTALAWLFCSYLIDMNQYVELVIHIHTENYHNGRAARLYPRLFIIVDQCKSYTSKSFDCINHWKTF